MLVSILLVFLVAACIGAGSSRGTEPEPVVREQPGKELCLHACEVMAHKLVNAEGGVGCGEVVPAPSAPGIGDIACFDGGPPNDCVSCRLFCWLAHENGAFWNTACIAKSITKCEEIETVCNVQK
jgi:hypothetical protein